MIDFKLNNKESSAVITINFNLKKMKTVLAAIIIIAFVIFCICACMVKENTSVKTGFYKTGKMKLLKGLEITGISLNDGTALLASKGLAEIYNPKTNKFSVVKKMHFPLKKPGVVVLNDGRALFAGLLANPADKQDKMIVIEIFNPETKNFEVVIKHPVKQALNNLDVLKLKNGNIFISIGNNHYIYDVNNNVLSDNITLKDSSYIFSDAEQTSAVLTDEGKVLIFGLNCYKKSDKDKKRNHVFEYDPDTNLIKEAGTLVEERTGNIKAFKKDAENVVVIGGKCGALCNFNNLESIRTVETYNIKTKKSEITGELPVSYNNIFTQTVLLDDNKLLFNIPGSCIDHRCLYMKPFMYDLEENYPKNPDGLELNYIRNHIASLVKLKDGTVLFAGGAKKGKAANIAYRYYPKKK